MADLDEQHQQHHHEIHKSKQNRLVLCFDGTGNEFLGNSSDTNVVKIYQMLDRTAKDQFHYYQPGIGTYTSHDSNSSTQSRWTKFKATIAAALDQGVGTSFGTHVVAGYRFLMRYYSEGDAIYIFGFSRGAYTARFLAEMVNTIGLLSRGNDEMVHFAWKAFSDYQAIRGNDPPSPEDLNKKEYMALFKETFCRMGVKIHFLGIFDCVNSVGQFELPLGSKSYSYIAQAPAEHIRHAVSIHERRLKFKPALFQQAKIENVDADIVEMWFAGNHADVGGGWGLAPNQKRLLSDNSLSWMIEEVRNLPDNKNPLKFLNHVVESNERKEVRAQRALQKNNPANFNKSDKSAQWWRRHTSRPHDMLRWGGGVGWFATFSWWILEVLPFFTRLELELEQWVPRHWPPNLGATRDIPHKASIHNTVYDLHKAGVLQDKEMPVLGGDGPPASAVNALRAARRSWALQRNDTKNTTKEGEKPAAAQWNDPDSGVAQQW